MNCSKWDYSTGPMFVLLNINIIFQNPRLENDFVTPAALF